MIRPHFKLHGHLGTVYAPMQWNETTSTSKMLRDCQEWLHNHYPEWSRAMVYLCHHNGVNSHNDVILIERGQML